MIFVLCNKTEECKSRDWRYFSFVFQLQLPQFTHARNQSSKIADMDVVLDGGILITVISG